jgi:pyruvate formate lyase activating enzyme
VLDVSQIPSSLLGVVERAEVLPFHQMGRYKWERLALDYTLEKTEPPTRAAIEHAVGIFRAAGLATFA